jgi:Kef-type K+ transport system membrane component KefB
MSIDQLLVILTVVFVAGRIGAEISHRLHQPAVVGEIIAGVVVGPAVLGVVPAENETLEVLAELGVIFLLFRVGLETDPGELRNVGGTAMAVAGAGVALPFALGLSFMLLLGSPALEAIFVGTAMVATSVGITASVLAAKKKLASKEARIILGAAVVDDLLTLMLLGVILAISQEEVSVSSVLVLAVSALGFVAIVGTLGRRVISRVMPNLDRLRINEPALGLTIAVALALAASSGKLGLAPLIGAFLAGIVLGQGRTELELEEKTMPLATFFVPFFFVNVGTKVELSVFSSGRGLMILAGVTALAIIGKFAGGSLASYRLGKRSAAIIGVGMVPRGEVGIVVANLAHKLGVVGSEIYGVVVAMSVLTAVIAPPALSRLFRESADDPRGSDPGC